MTLENAVALFRPYKISEEEREKLGKRLGREAVYNMTSTALSQRIAAIETKSGVLLTHVSIMIAISGLLLSAQSLHLDIDGLLTFELVAYLILAILCIRCQYEFDSIDFGRMVEKDVDHKNERPAHHLQKVMGGELVYRERLFRFSFRSLYVLTILLAATLIISLFSGVTK